VTRCYSLVGSAIDSNRSEYFISVRHVLPPPNALDAPDGLMSSFINQKLKHGAQVEIKAPGGQFILPSESDVPIVMIAGGIGITPFLSQLETVNDIPVSIQNSRIKLIKRETRKETLLSQAIH